jgi:hypothetical protein
MTAPDLLLLWPIVAVQAPTILLPFVGLILARSKLLPRGSASVLATLGFALLLLHAVGQLGLQIYLARDSARDVLAVLTVVSTAQRVLGFAALICLCGAIFAGRAKVEP